MPARGTRTIIVGVVIMLMCTIIRNNLYAIHYEYYGLGSKLRAQTRAHGRIGDYVRGKKRGADIVS